MEASEAWGLLIHHMRGDQTGVSDVASEGGAENCISNKVLSDANASSPDIPLCNNCCVDKTHTTLPGVKCLLLVLIPWLGSQTDNKWLVLLEAIKMPEYFYYKEFLMGCLQVGNHPYFGYKSSSQQAQMLPLKQNARSPLLTKFIASRVFITIIMFSAFL
jgi:hypothetical protein